MIFTHRAHDYTQLTPASALALYSSARSKADERRAAAAIRHVAKSIVDNRNQKPVGTEYDEASCVLKDALDICISKHLIQSMNAVFNESALQWSDLPFNRSNKPSHFSAANSYGSLEISESARLTGGTTVVARTPGDKGAAYSEAFTQALLAGIVPGATLECCGIAVTLGKARMEGSHVSDGPWITGLATFDWIAESRLPTSLPWLEERTPRPRANTRTWQHGLPNAIRHLAAEAARLDREARSDAEAELALHALINTLAAVDEHLGGKTPASEAAWDRSPRQSLVEGIGRAFLDPLCAFRSQHAALSIQLPGDQATGQSDLEVSWSAGPLEVLETPSTITFRDTGRFSVTVRTPMADGFDANVALREKISKIYLAGSLFAFEGGRLIVLETRIRGCGLDGARIVSRIDVRWALAERSERHSRA